MQREVTIDEKKMMKTVNKFQKPSKIMNARRSVSCCHFDNMTIK